MAPQPDNRETLRLLASNERLPAVVVDLDAFDRNVRKTAEMVRQGGKKLRLATKSLRVPGLISRALELSQGTFQGLMCFSAEEALFLRSQGFDDFLLAYPTLSPTDLRCLRELHEGGAKITMTVDHPEQVERLAEAMKGCAKPFRALLDVDVSLRYLGGLIHLGVRRSRIRSVADAMELCAEIARHPELRAAGLMAYEAQVAGLGDRNPFKRLINPFAHWIRKLSLPRVARLRSEIADAMRARGLSVEIVNGGGTGSLDFALPEAALTEVTIGSGLLCSHLFDYYSNIRFEPACYFALQAVRTSDPGYVTCLGGGFVASGEPGWDKVPLPAWPEGLKLLGSEACGEVQTPLKLPPETQVALGSAVLFRHAKAGELAERFDEYVLVSQGKIASRAKTYRGLGHCFF
jgi:D-serine deaminase-like pyridoxal phosphate-dependent protein